MKGPLTKVLVKVNQSFIISHVLYLVWTLIQKSGIPQGRDFFWLGAEFRRWVPRMIAQFIFKYILNSKYAIHLLMYLDSPHFACILSLHFGTASLSLFWHIYFRVHLRLKTPKCHSAPTPPRNGAEFTAVEAWQYKYYDRLCKICQLLET